MADKNIKDIVSSYLKNNEIFGTNAYKPDEYIEVEPYQLTLKSTHANHIKTTKANKEQKLVHSTPLNNINFSKTVSMGLTDRFTHSAFYLLSSLYSKGTNEFLIDGKLLTILFKSGLGIMDLPYSLILYFGGLHYFNKNKSKNPSILGGSDFYRTASTLDGDSYLDIKIDGYIVPNYKTKEINILNDYYYRTDYVTKFIPKFGYGTLSNFMNDYYNFVVDRTQVNQSGFDKKQPFHIYGAQEGFVKSFKTYRDSNTYRNNLDPKYSMNFMGHYTILKNSYGFTNLPSDITNLANSFKTEAITAMANVTVLKAPEANFKKMFLIYSKLKTAYLYNTTGLATQDDLIKTITALNATIKTNFTYRYYGNQISNCGAFSYFIYKMLFGKLLSNQQLEYVDLEVLINNFELPGTFFDSLRNSTSSNNIQIENELLTKFLMSFWDVEKKYMNNQETKFGNTSSNFMVLLYPSAGGVFSPNNLFNIDTSEFTIRPLTGDNNDHSLYLSTNDADSLRQLSFDNRSVIENATRFLWYDTANAGSQLGSKDYVDTNFNLEQHDTLLTDKSYTTNTKDNFFNNIYKGTDGIMSLLRKNSLSVQDLYEIIDMEKFEYFEEKFLEFATRYADGNNDKFDPSTYNDWIFTKNNDNFTFETLIKAISTIGYNDIISVDPKTIDVNYTNDDFVYFLIGYSSYNYYFCDYFGISKIINSFLTLCQYNKNESEKGVLNEFLSQKLSVNNYSTIGAVTLPKNLETYTNYHNYMFRPDVIFSAVDNNFGAKETIPYLSYYVNKLIFGDNNTSKYEPLENEDVALSLYIDDYISTGRTSNDGTHIIYKKDKYGEYGKKYSKNDIVKMLNYFFKILDVELNDNNFKMLYNLFMGLLNSGEVSAGISDPTSLIEDYLINFLNDFYKNSKSNINLFLLNILSKISDKNNPNSPNSLYKKTISEDRLLDLKTTTYYNIKNLYDKFVSYQPNDIKFIKEKFSEYNDLSVSTGEFDKTNGLLFYNYMFKDLSTTNTLENSISANSLYDSSTPKHLAEYLNIVDRGNNDIGTDILIDVIQLGDAIQLKFDTNGSNDNSELTSKSVYGVFSDVASHNGFILHPINSYVSYFSNLKGKNGNDLLQQHAYDMFGLHTNTDRIDSNPSFSLQWIAHSSSLLDQKTNTISKQRLTNSFSLDIDLYDSNKLLDEGNIPNDLTKGTGNVTSFIVDFGNKNQQMFKNIHLDTSEFSNTEESINSYVNLVAKGDQAGKVVSGNLFKMLETRSYTCQVETLGNALIQPMGYFYLKNVPLFKGSYLIMNVDHKLTPNNMVTTFKGVRQPIIAKTNNRSDVLNAIENTLKDISRSTDLVITSDTTKGTILQDRKNTDAAPYGMFYQSMVASSQYSGFPGIQILYSLISSEFPSQTNDLYKLFISVIYNRAKYWAQTNEKSVNPSIVAKYMVDVVLSLSANYATADVKPYFDVGNPNNKGSLSFMTNEYKVDSTNPIYVTLTEIAKAKDTAAVIKLLTPSNLTSQKLNIRAANGNNNSNDNNIFNTTTKNDPKIIYNDSIDTNKDFSKSWEAIDIIYMNSVVSDPTKIYTTKVNNENILEYVYLNPFAVDNLTLNHYTNELTYLGCYDSNKGITFFGRTFSDTIVDNYASNIVNYSPKTLLSAYSSVANGQTTTLKPISPNVINRYTLVDSQNPGFKAKVQEVATNIGGNELDLVRIMYAESGIRSKAQYGDKGKDIPYTTNRAATATGFIQFLESTAENLGTTTRDLYNMSPINQMVYVEKYFKAAGFKSSIKRTIYDLYSAVFYPALIGKPDNYILGSLTVPYEDKSNSFNIADKNTGITKHSTRLVDGKKVIDVSAFKLYVNGLV